MSPIPALRQNPFETGGTTRAVPNPGNRPRRVAEVGRQPIGQPMPATAPDPINPNRKIIRRNPPISMFDGIPVIPKQNHGIGAHTPAVIKKWRLCSNDREYWLEKLSIQLLNDSFGPAPWLTNDSSRSPPYNHCLTETMARLSAKLTGKSQGRCFSPIESSRQT